MNNFSSNRSIIPDKEYSKERRFSRYEKMIKGRVAEALIEELFVCLHYNVFRYGMENTIPSMKGLLKGVKSDVANNIRRMPDLIVQNNRKGDSKKGEVYFVEVKFRSNEKFTIKSLYEDKYGPYPYEKCYFIVVSKKHIKCITYQELKEKHEKITPYSNNLLGYRKEFNLNEEDRQIIVAFCKFAVKFFENV